MPNAPDFAAIVRALSDKEVEYFIIGGLAVGYHGFIRGTKDVDIVPKPDRDNLERLAEALREINAQVEGTGDFQPGELPDPTDVETLASGGNWVLDTRYGRLDLFQWIGDGDLWGRYSQNCAAAEIDGINVKIVGYADLLEMKRKAARPEDLIDLEKLEQARAEGE